VNNVQRATLGLVVIATLANTVAIWFLILAR